MKDLLKDMTPIEYAGATIIGILALTFVVSFSSLVIAIITGEVDLANASYGFAESTWNH
jgi:hypothetical protein